MCCVLSLKKDKNLFLKSRFSDITKTLQNQDKFKAFENTDQPEEDEDEDSAESWEGKGLFHFFVTHISINYSILVKKKSKRPIDAEGWKIEQLA